MAADAAVLVLEWADLGVLAELVDHVEDLADLLVREPWRRQVQADLALDRSPVHRRLSKRPWRLPQLLLPLPCSKRSTLDADLEDSLADQALAEDLLDQLADEDRLDSSEPSLRDRSVLTTLLYSGVSA